MGRRAIVLALVLSGCLAIGFAHHAAAGPAVPTCFDYRTNLYVPATKWLPADQPGTLVGTPGDDVLVGSTGSDVIKGLGGNDIICYDDSTTAIAGAPDTIDAGAGNDDIFGAGTLHGGSGNDFIQAIDEGTVGYGDSGNDTLVASNGATLDGGSGDDSLESSYGGANRLLGGSGLDTVNNATSANLIDCGSNTDRVYANGAPTVRRCENAYNPG